MARKKPVGWRKEPVRHGLAAKGIKTGRKPGRVESRIHEMEWFKHPTTGDVSLLPPGVAKKQGYTLGPFESYTEASTQKRPTQSPMQRSEAEQILYRIGRKHIPPETFMDLTGELYTFSKEFPEGSNERKALEEINWIFVQLADDPPRLLKEKWGFSPKKEPFMSPASEEAKRKMAKRLASRRKR